MTRIAGEFLCNEVGLMGKLRVIDSNFRGSFWSRFLRTRPLRTSLGFCITYCYTTRLEKREEDCHENQSGQRYCFSCSKHLLTQPHPRIRTANARSLALGGRSHRLPALDLSDFKIDQQGQEQNKHQRHRQSCSPEPAFGECV